MPHSRSTPWLIIVLIAGFILFTGWSFYRASRETSAVTDPEYYSHGLRYNQSLLEQRAADSLGWHVTVRYERGQLLVSLTDSQQQPVSGAHGVLSVFPSDRPQPLQFSLGETSAGLYQAALPSGLSGDLTAEVSFDRSGARLQRRLLLAMPRQ